MGDKKVTPTDVYKEHLQAIIQQEIGVKVSKDKAWKLFKAIILGTVQHVAKMNGGKLSLAGIGSFEVLKAGARGKKAGLDENGQPIPGAVVWPFVPKFRFRPSASVNAVVEKMFGLGDHDDLELKDYGIYAAPVAEEATEASAEDIMPAPQEAAPAPAVDDFFAM